MYPAPTRIKTFVRMGADFMLFSLNCKTCEFTQFDRPFVDYIPEPPCRKNYLKMKSSFPDDSGFADTAFALASGP